MNLEHMVKGNALVIRPKEKRIDASVASDFKSKMDEFVQGGYVNFVINLAEVELIDSSGLGALVSILKKIGSRGEIRLCKAKTNVKSLFELTRLNKVFSFYHTEEEAVESF